MLLRIVLSVRYCLMYVYEQIARHIQNETMKLNTGEHMHRKECTMTTECRDSRFAQASRLLQCEIEIRTNLSR